MIKIKDIAWLAGILEGEGWFGLHRKKHPSISVLMTDKDIIVRASNLMKSNIYTVKNAWVTQLSGAHAIQWMMTLYPFFGERRREAVRMVIKNWRERCTNAPSRYITHPTCHPDRKLRALDLCNPCYQRQWKEKRLLKVI